MADVTVTVNTMTAINKTKALTASPATETVADTAQKFVITPTKAGHQLVLTMGAASGQGSVAFEVAAGMLGKKITGSVAQATTVALTLDDGYVKDTAGKITITATPASGKILLTNHAFTMTAIEIPA